MNLKIIIILPVHNRREITRKFLECLNDQTYKNWHLIMVDDGCTDGTVEMAESIIKNITVLKGNGNLWWAGSLQMAYNYLKKNRIFSQDDIICIMNDDTLIKNDYLLTAADVFSKSKGISIIVPSIAINNSNGEISSIGEWYDCKKMSFEHSNIIEKINCLSTWGLFIKFADFVQSGGFYPKLLPHYLSDFEYTFRQIKNGTKVISNEKLKITFFPEYSGFESPKMDNDFISYIKTVFSYKNKSNPFHWIVFVFLTTRFPYNFMNACKIVGLNIRKVSVVVYRNLKDIAGK